MKSKRFNVLRYLFAGSLVKQIVVGLIAGILLAQFSTHLAQSVGILGNLFVAALKSVAPLLVLVISAIASHRIGQKTNIRPIIFLYLLSTLIASLVAVVGSKIWPQYLTLPIGKTTISAPSDIRGIINECGR